MAKTHENIEGQTDNRAKRFFKSMGRASMYPTMGAPLAFAFRDRIRQHRDVKKYGYVRALGVKNSYASLQNRPAALRQLRLERYVTDPSAELIALQGARAKATETLLERTVSAPNNAERQFPSLRSTGDNHATAAIQAFDDFVRDSNNELGMNLLALQEELFESSEWRGFDLETRTALYQQEAQALIEGWEASVNEQAAELKGELSVAVITAAYANSEPRPTPEELTHLAEQTHGQVDALVTEQITRVNEINTKKQNEFNHVNQQYAAALSEAYMMSILKPKDRQYAQETMARRQAREQPQGNEANVELNKAPELEKITFKEVDVMTLSDGKSILEKTEDGYKLTFGTDSYDQAAEDLIHAFMAKHGGEPFILDITGAPDPQIANVIYQKIQMMGLADQIELKCDYTQAVNKKTGEPTGQQVKWQPSPKLKRETEIQVDQQVQRDLKVQSDSKTHPVAAELSEKFQDAREARRAAADAVNFDEPTPPAAPAA